MILRGILADRPPYRKFLLIVGLTLVSAITFTILGSLISVLFFGINPMTNPGILNDTGNPAVINSLKFIQFFSGIGTFILPPFIAAYLFDIRPFAYLGLERKAKPIIFIAVILLMF